jgi:hypothetical protein
VLAPAPVVEPDTIVVLDPIPVAADAVVDLVAIEAAEQPAAGLR